MSEQPIQLAQWSSFFSITSTASATLLGLLFVVITIAPTRGRSLACKSKAYLTPAVLFLTSALITSALLAIPNQTRRSAVICICVAASGGLFYSGSLAMRGESYEKFSHRYRYAVAPFIAYVVLFSGGILLRKDAVGVDLVAAGMLALINLAIRNTWAIAVAIVGSQERVRPLGSFTCLIPDHCGLLAVFEQAIACWRDVGMFPRLDNIRCVRGLASWRTRPPDQAPLEPVFPQE